MDTTVTYGHNRFCLKNTFIRQLYFDATDWPNNDNCKPVSGSHACIYFHQTNYLASLNLKNLNKLCICVLYCIFFPEYERRSGIITVFLSIFLFLPQFSLKLFYQLITPCDFKSV